jgi:hypothetical protein
MPSEDSGRPPIESSRAGSSERPRAPLLERLGFQFSNSPRDPRLASPEKDATAANVNITPPQDPMLKSSSVASSSKIRSPTIRWLGGKSSECREITAEPEENQHQGDTTDISGPSMALQQAINDQLPNKPPQAFIRTVSNPPQHHFTTSQSFRGPPLLNSLARSTLPAYCQPCNPDTTNLPILVNQPPPSRTSLESLKSLKPRGVHTSGSQPETFTPSPTRSWFRWENKPSVDQLLVEEDRAETITGEEDNIRRKCELHAPVRMPLVDHSPYRSLPSLSNRVLPWPARV